MSTSHIAITFSLIVSAMTVVSCNHSGKEERVSEVPEIEVAEATTDSVTLYKTYPGTLSASKTVDIVARVNGYLRTVNFEGGDLVEKGQVLYTIEDQTYRDAVQEATAQLASAKSSYDYNSRQYAAMKKAFESDAVSQMEVLQAKNAMESSESSIRQAQAALNSARTNLSYCTVRAPMRGHITTTDYDPGNYLSGEATPVKLATLYNDAALNANFYIEDASYLRSFNNDNGRGGINYKAIPINFTEPLPHSYTGDLSYMAPDIDPSTGTMRVYAKVENPYGELRDGMYVEVRLPWKSEPKAVVIKDAAISTDQLGKYVYVVNDSDKVVYTPIKAGDLYNDTLRVVTEGLRPGQRYVTKALLKVRPDMKVKPVMTR